MPTKLLHYTTAYYQYTLSDLADTMVEILFDIGTLIQIVYFFSGVGDVHIKLQRWTLLFRNDASSTRYSM